MSRPDAIPTEKVETNFPTLAALTGSVCPVRRGGRKVVQALRDQTAFILLVVFVIVGGLSSDVFLTPRKSSQHNVGGVGARHRRPRADGLADDAQFRHVGRISGRPRRHRHGFWRNWPGSDWSVRSPSGSWRRDFRGDERDCGRDDRRQPLPRHPRIECACLCGRAFPDPLEDALHVRASVQ